MFIEETETFRYVFENEQHLAESKKQIADGIGGYYRNDRRMLLLAYCVYNKETNQFIKHRLAGAEAANEILAIARGELTNA